MRFEGMNDAALGTTRAPLAASSAPILEKNRVIVGFIAQGPIYPSQQPSYYMSDQTLEHG